jgi:hypothetical protein
VKLGEIHNIAVVPNLRKHEAVKKKEIFISDLGEVMFWLNLPLP